VQYKAGDRRLLKFRCTCGEVSGLTRFPIRLRCSCGEVINFDADGKPDHKPRARGLGDIVAGVTRRLGLKSCGGCKKRQKILNDWVPFKKR